MITGESIVTSLILFSSLFLTIQGIITLLWMLYAWEDPEYAKTHKSPSSYEPPTYSFTALIPARHEERVIKDTIKAVHAIRYPEEQKEILVLCRTDDQKTIKKANEAIQELNSPHVRLVTFDDFPINKPHSLNKGLSLATRDIIAVFDAEDEPHPDMYHIVNTVMLREHVDAVQCGVQLVNYRSKWFSSLNVVEYYLWFKSGLHFFNRFGKIVPLGGNTVFVRKDILKNIQGWDEQCLTEDADLGIRLTLFGAKIKVIYDEQHATKEETPHSLSAFIKQRTRWNQGFLQIFLKRDWKKLPHIRQKVVVLYILLSPVLHTLLLLYAPFAVFIAMTEKIPVVISLFSFLPLYLLGLQILVSIYALYEFTRNYKLSFTWWMPLHIILTFYPYQLSLGYASFRALYRMITRQANWEKTLHHNAHRSLHHKKTTLYHLKKTALYSYAE